jgi:hypothetical protein
LARALALARPTLRVKRLAASIRLQAGDGLSYDA